MKKIKRKILQETSSKNILTNKKNLKVGNTDPCCVGILPEQEFDIQVIDEKKVFQYKLKIPLYNVFNDIGLLDDTDYVKTDVVGLETLCTRYPGIELTDIFDGFIWVRGKTENKLEFVKSYIEGSPYQVNLNLANNPQINFTGVIGISSDRVRYVINGDVSSGNYVPGTGIIYDTFDTFREVVFEHCEGDQTVQIRDTDFKINKECDFSLSATTKQDYKLGIAYPQFVENNVFIERGNTSPFERHFKFQEIKSVDDIERYGNRAFFDLFSG